MRCLRCQQASTESFHAADQRKRVKRDKSVASDPPSPTDMQPNPQWQRVATAHRTVRLRSLRNLWAQSCQPGVAALWSDDGWTRLLHH